MAFRILLVDDDTIFRESLLTILQKRGFSCDQAKDGQEAYEKVLSRPYDIIISDIDMPRMNGIKLMESVRSGNPDIFFIIVTAYGSMETAIQALRQGAFDYIIKPFKFDDLIVKLNKLIEHKALVLENIRLRQEINRKYDFDNIVGHSLPMQKIFTMIRRISESDSSVFINGKNGTGKELLARTIHYHSPRKNGPFVVMNCNAYPKTAIEDELFGRVGDDAATEKKGFLLQADKGALFLDEIGDLPLNIQLKLLRAIEQKEILPVGGSTPVRINVRIISATNQDILNDIQDQRFREDLYFRLNVIHIDLPELAERKEDIPLLINHFISRFNREMGKNIKGMSPDAIELLVTHQWRGEVRELENIVERAMIFAQTDVLGVEVLPDYLIARETSMDEKIPDGLTLDEATRKFQYIYIRKVLEKNKGHKGKTAKKLQISEPTLYRKMLDYQPEEGET